MACGEAAADQDPGRAHEHRDRDSAAKRAWLSSRRLGSSFVSRVAALDPRAKVSHPGAGKLEIDAEVIAFGFEFPNRTLEAQQPTPVSTECDCACGGPRRQQAPSFHEEAP